jgi:hypothetical protein
MPLSILMGLLAILSWSISIPISSSASPSLLVDYPAFLGMVYILPQGDIAPPVITPNAEVGSGSFSRLMGRIMILIYPKDSYLFIDTFLALWEVMLSGLPLIYQLFYP